MSQPPWNTDVTHMTASLWKRSDFPPCWYHHITIQSILGSHLMLIAYFYVISEESYSLIKLNVEAQYPAAKFWN